MRASFLSLLSLAAAASLFAADIPIYSADEAAQHVGEVATVHGAVFDVYVSKSNNAYLNFGAKYPNHNFAGAVLISKTPELLANGTDWLKELQGKEVAITGSIELNKGKPQIVILKRENLVATPVPAPAAPETSAKPAVPATPAKK